MKTVEKPGTVDNSVDSWRHCTTVLKLSTKSVDKKPETVNRIQTVDKSVDRKRFLSTVLENCRQILFVGFLLGGDSDLAHYWVGTQGPHQVDSVENGQRNAYKSFTRVAGWRDTGLRIGLRLLGRANLIHRLLSCACSKSRGPEIHQIGKDFSCAQTSRIRCATGEFNIWFNRF